MNITVLSSGCLLFGRMTLKSTASCVPLIKQFWHQICKKFQTPAAESASTVVYRICCTMSWKYIILSLCILLTLKLMQNLWAGFRVKLIRRAAGTSWRHICLFFLVVKRTEILQDCVKVQGLLTAQLYKKFFIKVCHNSILYQSFKMSSS